MRQFGLISCSIWRSRRFRALASDAARLVYLYLHTTTHGNSVGTFVLPPEMAALDLKISADQVREAYVELAQVGLTRYDHEEELVQIRDFFRFNAISSRKHLQGPLRVIHALPQSPVRDCAACDLVLAIFDRREEWADKVRRFRMSETQADRTSAANLTEAISAFDVSAADLVKEMDLKRALGSPEINLDADTLDRLGEALLIPLSHTPIRNGIDITDKEKETEKETEKEKTTEKDKTKTTETETGDFAGKLTASDLLNGFRERLGG